MLQAHPLEPFLQRAGAVMTTRHGRSVAAHYGSAAGELAVCVRRVGLVARSELSLLGVHAPAGLLDEATARLVGGASSVGGVIPARGSWWCRTSATEMLVICSPAAGTRVEGLLRAEARRVTELELSDRSEELAAIGVVGRAAPPLLAALGAYGPGGQPRLALPVVAAEVGGVEALWLHQSDVSALAVVGDDAAGRAWQAIEQCGRAFGLSCVGIEAAERFGLLTRTPCPPV